MHIMTIHSWRRPTLDGGIAEHGCTYCDRCILNQVGNLHHNTKKLKGGIEFEAYPRLENGG
jgi:hypothetical protein